MKSNYGTELSPILSFSGGFPININQSVIAAVSGQKIRVLGYTVQSSTGVQSTYGFINGSGGTSLSSFIAPPSTAAPFTLPIVYAGYFETSTGVGLFIDVATAAVTVNVYYITYIP
jgi:hypothetical protein